jgi:FlaA1/EpsC-like NDP-sugar epimerase
MEQAREQSIPLDQHALASLSGKSVLVTGAGGSIGSALCAMIVKHARKLVLVSVSESALYRVQKLLGNPVGCEVIGVLADYGDAVIVGNYLDDVDIVVHAGAHKHVNICEQNPASAILNNVWGTQKLLNACALHNVRQFIQISTDKAVEPASIMGATKRVCELLCTRRDHGGVNVAVVRFGNVYGSDGSVIPLWREQIAKGGPLTLTDRGATRFFMSVEDACRLILAVIYMNERGTYVFDMGDAVRMEDLAQQMIINSGMDIEIVETGLRPGEKLEEELYHGGLLEPTKHPLVKKVIEHGKKQPSHQLVPDMVEHARRNRPAEAIDTLWKIVREAVK